MSGTDTNILNTISVFNGVLFIDLNLHYYTYGSRLINKIHTDLSASLGQERQINFFLTLSSFSDDICGGLVNAFPILDVLKLYTLNTIFDLSHLVFNLNFRFDFKLCAGYFISIDFQHLCTGGP